MTLRTTLWGAVEGLPDDASVTLPVGWLRQKLEEAEAESDGLDDDRLFTVAELASRYDRAESTVRGWLCDGRLRGTKIAGSWRVSAEALREFESDDEDDGPALGSGREVDLGRWREQKSM